jgi:hypothetical protein
MRTQRLILSLLCPCALLLGACSKSDTGTPAAKTVATAKLRLKACEMVTQAEMTAILGNPTNAALGRQSEFRTECVYSPASGSGPSAGLTVEWDSGPAAMAAAGIAASNSPAGMVDPLQGLGEQAVQVGTMLMINTGKHLVTLEFSGVNDTVPKARQIYATAMGRM